jgi:hypothetical protein
MVGDRARPVNGGAAPGLSARIDDPVGSAEFDTTIRVLVEP